MTLELKRYKDDFFDNSDEAISDRYIMLYNQIVRIV